LLHSVYGVGTEDAGRAGQGATERMTQETRETEGLA
jgi:hypothetical protein